VARGIEQNQGKRLREALAKAEAPWTLTGGDAACLVDRLIEPDVMQIYVRAEALTVLILPFSWRLAPPAQSACPRSR
jgi:hypothetical protein